MRLYLKLLVMIVIFLCASNAQVHETTRNLAYEARVAFVCRFGSAADFEALVDDTHRMLAEEQGGLDLYEAGKRWRQLLAERIEVANRKNVALADEQLDAISAEAFQPLLDMRAERTGSPPQDSFGVPDAAMTHWWAEPLVLTTRPRP